MIFSNPSFWANIKEAILHLSFPSICEGCGSEGERLCAYCASSLPSTNFHRSRNNAVEKIFWGRLPLRFATSQYYFSTGSLIQKLMHRIKYKDDPELAHYLGRQMGLSMMESDQTWDLLLPLPLHPQRERARGYNQSQLLCEGMSEVMGIDVDNSIIGRPTVTETQTKKGRTDRWKNMEGMFQLKNPNLKLDKHVLLVDDVITTGATLEACGRAILSAQPLSLSIATLCYAEKK